MLNLPAGKASTLSGHTGPVLAARFNSDGNYCLTCGQDRVLKLWNPVKGLCVKTYLGHGHEIYDVAVAKDNSRLASVGGDKVVFYWDVPTGQVIRKYKGHELKVNTVKFAGDDDSVVVSGSYDKTVRIFDCRSRSFDPIQTMAHFKDSVTSIAVRGHEICAGSVDGYIRTFDIRAGEVTSDCVGQAVTCVTLTEDGNCALTSCMDSKVRLFDRSNGELLQSYAGHKNTSYRVESCMTRGDAYVVSGSEDGTIHFWDLVGGKEMHKLTGHEGVVCSLSYHPTETCLLSTSVDGTAVCWR
mmetsp:Transcript_6441/g.15082  ORF Transcript_6441/g.15082 Transcript_6441/m.15082 type:complete len:298 (-) Transcript_6441:314-1207(-)